MTFQYSWRATFNLKKRSLSLKERDGIKQVKEPVRKINNYLPCRFCNGKVMMPPAAAAATSPWMLVRFAVGRVRTSPCWPPSCPAMLKGIRIGWFSAGVPPGITPATAEANCWAVSSGCKKPQTQTYFTVDSSVLHTYNSSGLRSFSVPLQTCTASSSLKHTFSPTQKGLTNMTVWNCKPQSHSIIVIPAESRLDNSLHMHQR